MPWSLEININYRTITIIITMLLGNNAAILLFNPIIPNVTSTFDLKKKDVFIPV